MLTELARLSGLTIIKDDFITFENSLEFEFDRGYLYNDMFQAVSRQHNLLLDIGWITPDESFSNGFFKIVIVENQEWDTPLLTLEAKDKITFLHQLHIVQSFITDYKS